MKAIVLRTHRYMVGRGYVFPYLDDWFKDTNHVQMYSAVSSNNHPSSSNDNVVFASTVYDMYFNKRSVNNRGSSTTDLTAEMILVRRIPGTSHISSIPREDKYLAKQLIGR
jgi:hypothetical protein